MSQGNEAITDEQLAADDQESQVEPDVSVASPEEGQEAEGRVEELPEKFKGKSAKEIADAYSHLEKKLGEISSERSHREKEAEALSARLSQMEHMLQQQVQQQSEADPLEGLEQEFLHEPEKAIGKLKNYVREQGSRTREQLEIESRSRDAASYYERMKKENQDFAELEPEMQRLARQYGSLVDRRHLNSPETIELLYKLAKANNIDRYTSVAAEKAKQASDLVKEEKRRAKTASSGKGSSGSQNFADLDLAEMRRKLGVVDDE